MKTLENGKALGPGNIPVDVWDYLWRECTGVPDETVQLYNCTYKCKTVQLNNGKWEEAGGVAKQRSDTHLQEHGRLM